MLLPITLTIAAAAALVNIWLAMRCSQVRSKLKISIGDGDNALLRTRMRAHANFNENTPLFVILLGLVELGGHSALWLWGVGILFILGRIAHPIGMERPGMVALRATGALLTLVLQLVLAVYAIVLSYQVGAPTMLG